jgi:ATP-dependent Clp protease adaptor protein ClpS
MSKIVEVKLALQIVTPLVAKIRAMAGESDVHEIDHRAREMSALVALFNNTYVATGVITLNSSHVVPVTRACAALRLRLRATALASIADETLERGSDAEKYGGAVRDDVMCYLFLATIQELLLKNFPVGCHERLIWTFRPLAWWRRRSKSATVKTDTSASGETWAVIVTNDPVNTMTYVAYVFQRELRISEPEAKRHMLEVHEAKRSVVWKGGRAQAEARAHALRDWHLQATAERET